MGNKADLLTEEDMRSFLVEAGIWQRIREYSDAQIKPRDQINILDWGCGRGRTVTRLLEVGFNAYGVDTNELYLTNGRPLLAKRGYDEDERLLAVQETKRFQDGYFDIIFTQQVIEHIRDIEAVISEMARLTKSGGIGIHEFPGKYCIKESHLHIPFVHWLPKNLLRKIYLSTFFRFNKEPGWRGLIGKSRGIRMHTYYEYLNEYTYYRTIHKLTSLFKKYDFDILYMNTDKENKSSFLKKNGFPQTEIFLLLHKI
ncbi:MAG: class I SAM-dependent methyltransferase [Candidatus Omnitrophica bacterium]|nr:class I SAM-dependent methyltransferase [Candidatus Omnitrophota bacterium]